MVADGGGLRHLVLHYDDGTPVAKDLADDPCDSVGEVCSAFLRQSLPADEGQGGGSGGAALGGCGGLALGRELGPGEVPLLGRPLGWHDVELEFEHSAEDEHHEPTAWATWKTTS